MGDWLSGIGIGDWDLDGGLVLGLGIWNREWILGIGIEDLDLGLGWD